MAPGYFFDAYIYIYIYSFLMRAGYFFLMHFYFIFDTCLERDPHELPDKAATNRWLTGNDSSLCGHIAFMIGMNLLVRATLFF